MGLRRIKIKKGFILDNLCGIELEGNFPMVGCKYCKEECPYYNGEYKFLIWKFVKCKK